jgi:hypothetical protein
MNSRMHNLISRIQRELPDTDKDRYDAAYERGMAQARSGNLFGGLAFGAIVGAVLMFLFDPDRGAGRRAQLASRATGLRNDLARTAGGRVEDLQNRAKGAAIEAGIAKPNVGTPAHRGNGTPVAGLPVDDDVPGANVPDPLKPEEIMHYGASGPIAGATLASAPLADADEQDAWEAAEREAKRASESQPAG